MIRRRTVVDSTRYPCGQTCSPLSPQRLIVVEVVVVLFLCFVSLLRLEVYSFVPAVSILPSTTTVFSLSSSGRQHPCRIMTYHRHSILTATTTTTSEESKDDTSTVIKTILSPVVATGKVLQQMVIIDGPEWQSVQQQLLRLSSSTTTTPTKASDRTMTSSSSPSIGGIYNVITGSIDGVRMVGMQHLLSTGTTKDSDKTLVTLDQDSTQQLYRESIAYIPDDVTEMDAIWTMIQSFSTIHCSRLVVTNIGGAEGTIDFVPSSSNHNKDNINSNNTRVVIVGNNPLAIQIATILNEVFQYNVTIVATATPIIPKTTATGGGIQYLPPSMESTVDDDDDDDDDIDESVLLGFAAVLDQFDVLIDTIGNELSNSIICENLKANHNCHIYLSTMSESQRIILQNGLIFGPNQSKEHIQKLVSSVATTGSNKNRPIYFPAPFGLGTTVQTILQKGMILKPLPTNNNNVFVRGWSLKDFWEYTTWPRDATTSNSRFGFPSDVSDKNKQYYDGDFDDDNDDESTTTMISAPPLRSTPGRDMFQTRPENFEMDDDDDGSDASKSNGSRSADRFVMDVATVNDLQLIVQNEMTCIVFVSAPFCRTCRYLKPQFVRMARQHRSMTPTITTTSDDSSIAGSNQNSFQFIKAEATGQIGKDIGRALGIDTVPTFILYKNGRRYGTPITSVTRLPSKDLDDTIFALQQNRTVDFTSLFPPETPSIDDDNSSDRTKKNRSKLS